MKFVFHFDVKSGDIVNITNSKNVRVSVDYLQFLKIFIKKKMGMKDLRLVKDLYGKIVQFFEK